MANLERSDVDGVTVLRLKGTLDRIELGDVEQTFREATHRDHASVVIDLADVNFLTTPAIAMFLDAAKTLRHSGGRVVVTGPSPRVEDVLRRLRLDSLLPVVGSVAEGIARVLASPDAGRVMGERGIGYADECLDVERSVAKLTHTYRALRGRRR